MTQIIYLDNNATTEVDNRVKQFVSPYFDQFYGNASGSYDFSTTGKKILEYSRASIGELIGCEENEILFTSCATESINFALKGLALHPLNTKKHIITCATEHKAVLETCKYLSTIGFEIEVLTVDENGELDLEELKSAIRQDTLLICIMWVNNETGVIHPIELIGSIANEYGVYFVCDGTQGIGKLSIDVYKCHIDILCFSAHKIYAPKGVGGIFLKETIISKNKMVPLIHGGGQEYELRSGTYNIPLIAGMGKAFEIAQREMERNHFKILKLRTILEDNIVSIKGATVNCKTSNRIFNTTNVFIPNFEVSVFQGLNKDVVLSTGSACNSALLQPSHVLTAMGVSNEDALSCFRISLGVNNLESEIFDVLKRINIFIGNL